MARQLLFTFLIFFSVGAFGQENQAESNKTNFNTVFKNIKSGEFDGTANGVLFIKNSVAKIDENWKPYLFVN